MLLNKLHNEDCLLTMKNMDANSIDCIITDPPYGYSFMGKDWDKVVPSVEIWTECLRVMKPGAFAFIMSAPRQDVLSHMIINLDKAGFDTSFTSIYWTYAGGFPKATDIGKAVDKKLGVEREVIATKETKSGGMASVNKINLEQGFRPANYNEHGNTFDVTEATSEEAKKLNGSYAGFQPKPAVEIIIIVMKPLAEKSYTEQAMQNGKGVTWMDDARIPYEDNCRLEKGGTYGGNRKSGAGSSIFGNGEKAVLYGDLPTGRFPANLLVSDDILNDGKVYSSVKSSKEHSEYGDAFKFGGGVSNPENQYSDSGSFSRFFDIDKWWEERVKGLPENVRKVFPFLIIPKAAKSEKNFGCEGLNKPEREVRGNNQATRVCVDCGLTDNGSNDHSNCSGAFDYKQCEPVGNHHPTVKPIKLMSYLITLGSREGELIYDPFSGSGTTLIAARINRRDYIGSEISKEYYEIAEKRLLPFTSQTFLF